MNEYIIQDDYLCCPICLERYNNEKHKYPLCLKCGHTLCRSCAQLNTTTNKIKCPTLNIPHGSYSPGFEKNIYNLLI